MITIKQAGAFYRAYKENKLPRFNDGLISLMYEDATYGYLHREHKTYALKKLKSAMENIFAGNYKEAEEDMFNFLTDGKWNSLEQYLELQES